MTASNLTLISHKLCPYVQRARIVLAEKAIPHSVQFIDLADKPRWFLALSPLGKVPVLMVDDHPLFESAAIAEYLDETTPGSLMPDDPFERARHRAWIGMASAVLDTIAGLYNAPHEAAFEDRRDVLNQRFDTLEGELTGGPYFSGKRFSLVDAAFAPVFRYFEVMGECVDLGLFRDKPRVSAWRRTLAIRPSVRSAVVADYACRLRRFLVQRDGHISWLMAGCKAAS